LIYPRLPPNLANNHAPFLSQAIGYADTPGHRAAIGHSQYAARFFLLMNDSKSSSAATENKMRYRTYKKR
jgi:hypothetical protein